MKKYLVMVFFLTQAVMAQQGSEKISLSFENKRMQDVLQEIEQISSFSFYYVESWLTQEPLSGDYNKQTIDEILTSLFRDTEINYYVLDDGKVILTRNNAIYDKVPDFFSQIDRTLKDSTAIERTAETESAYKTPIFYKEQGVATEGPIGTIRIGREDNNRGKQNYLLSGYARNSKTGRPIEDLALVHLGSENGTSTNAEGFYEISLPAGPNLVEARALGIQTSQYRVIMYNDGELNLELNESLEALQEVVVEGNKISNVRQPITGITQIDVEEIKTIPLVLGERDILKVALTLPGISNAGEGAAGYNVRGGRTDQNLFLLDNAVIYNPAHFFGLFSALNPFTTGGVTIYKGNIPSEYGGRLSSVFDVTTKNGNSEKFAGEVSIGPVTGNITLETPIVKEKSSFLIGARGTYSDWILKSLDTEELRNSSASFYDVIGKYSHKIDQNNDLEVTGYYSRDNFSITSDSIFNFSNRLVSLKWDHTFKNEKNVASVIASNSAYRFNIEFDGDANGDFDLGYQINETELKLRMKSIFGEDHIVNYGLSGKLYQVEPGNVDPLNPESNIASLQIPKERGLEAAIFLSDTYTISEKFALDVGLRYSFYAALGASSQRVYEDNAPRDDGTLVEVREFDTNEFIETYGGPEARFSARYSITPDFSIKAGFNNTYQYIHTLSNNTTASPTDTWKLSDLNIEPQQAYQVSLGLFKNFNDGMYEVSLESYYKRSNNILDYKTGAQLLLNETIETDILQGDGRAYGLEFLVRKLTGRLNGWLGYTYARSFVRLDSDFNQERINGGDYFPSNFDKPHDFSLVANYKFTKRFSGSANFVYQTGRPVTFPIGTFEFNNADFVAFSERNKFRIPDFYRLDLSFNMEGNHKIKKFAHSFWNFSIYNVLGRNNPYSVFFVTEDGEIKAFQSSIFSIPIPTITYNFKF
nr:carboxypeptidase-like regulatory domain-containing protein [uncultured Allomuricauda sp.]